MSTKQTPTRISWDRFPDHLAFGLAPSQYDSHRTIFCTGATARHEMAWLC